MDTIFANCDTIVAGMRGKNMLAYSLSPEYGNTNCYDVEIVGRVCLTVVILALLLLIAFWSKLHKGERTLNGTVDNAHKEKAVDQKAESLSNKDTRDSNEERKHKIENQFLSFCEEHIKVNGNLNESILEDYKKVIRKYIPELTDKEHQEKSEDSKISKE